MKWARTIIILALIALVGFLAWLKFTAQDICIIVAGLATPTGIYISLKGKGTDNG